MVSYIIFVNLILTLNIWGTSSKTVEQFIIPIGESFSFDCQQDDSVFFTRRLGDWSKVDINDNRYSHFNFIYLNEENILRITINSAEAPHIGYYGCRNSASKSKSMDRIYQLVLADVETFYWSYICHGQVGACVRYDDPSDRTSSTFEIADQTNVDLFCCASVTGYDNVKINMSPTGDNREKIVVKRKKDLDGSLVICATQHTVFKRHSSNNQEPFRCKLMIDDRLYSSFTSYIEMKDEMPTNPDFDPTDDNTGDPKDGSNDEEYFNHKPSSGTKQGKVKTGKKIAIIIGSVIGGLLVFGLLYFLSFLFCCKERDVTNSTKNQSVDYSVVSTTEKSNATREPHSKQEPVYMEPAPLYVNSPIFVRL